MIHHRGILQVILLLAGLVVGLLPAEVSANKSNHTISALPDVVRWTMAQYFEGGGQRIHHHSDLLPVAQSFQQAAGVFVTLSIHGKSRACWGSLFPQQKDLVKETVASTLGALTKEYRYPPIQASEWRTLKPQVTVIRAVKPIESIAGQNPMKHGLLVRSGQKSGLLLPREAADAHYQLVQCKLKAGIRPKEPYQLYRIEADVFQ